MQTAQTDARPFTPYDPAPRTSRIWYLMIGAVAAVGLIVWMGRRDAPRESKPGVAGATVAATDAKAATGPAQPALAALQPARAVESANVGAAPSPSAKAAVQGPNVLGAAITQAAAAVSMVPASEVKRHQARAHKAELAAAKLRKELDALKRENAGLGRELSAMRAARLPPPPTQTEQILQSLAPALRGEER